MLLNQNNQYTILKETMSLATKFHPDPNDSTQYKRKRWYLQLWAIGNGEPKPIGVLSFNLSDFTKISPKNTIKLSFTKWFDKKAAIFLSTTVKEIDQNLDYLENVSNFTMDVSDTYSEWSNSLPNVEVISPWQGQSSSSTSDETHKSGWNNYNSWNESFVSSVREEIATSGIKMMQKSNLSKDSLLNQKLTNELAHYKQLLSEMNMKYQDLAEKFDTKESENIKRSCSKLQGMLDEKEDMITSLKSELHKKTSDMQELEEKSELEKYKMKMKIEYLTNKCFQLNCKIDRNDFTPDKKFDGINTGMIMDVIQKKQKEYCHSGTGGSEEYTDFLINIFAQYEKMQVTIHKLSEQNDDLKQFLVETKVKWAEAEGDKEKLSNAVNSLKNKLKSYGHDSHYSNETLSSQDTPEKAIRHTVNETQKHITQSFTGRYLSGLNFWSKSIN